MSVRGLITAATLWASAAVGTCAGADMVAQSALFTVFVVAGNTLLRPLVNDINRFPLDEQASEGDRLGFVERMSLSDRLASDTSTGRNFGFAPSKGGCGDVFGGGLAIQRATATNASMTWSRVNSGIWSVPNWVIATFSGLTPNSVRITRSNVTFACVRPMTPTRCPARSPIFSIFDARCFLEPLRGRPEGDHSTTTFLRRMAADSASAGNSRSPRATARSVFAARGGTPRVPPGSSDKDIELRANEKCAFLEKNRTSRQHPRINLRRSSTAIALSHD